MHVPRIVCGALLVATLAIAQSADQLDASERLSFADGLYAREMHDLAAPEYAAFIQNFPRAEAIDVAYFRLGECHRFLGNLAEADKAYTRVFADYPDSEFRHRAGFRRANLFKDADKPGAAIPLYRKLLESKPPPDIAAPAHYYLGDTLLQEGKAEEAAKEFEIVSEKYRGSAFFAYAGLKLASLQGEAGSEAELAIELYGDVLEKAETDRVRAEAIYQLAELHYTQENYTQSAKLFARLLTEFPNDQRTAGARLRAAWAAHKAGLYADALKTAIDSMKGARKPELAEWLYLKANCERQLSRNKAAVASYDSLLDRKLPAKLADAAGYERALTLYRLGRHKDAIAGARAVTLSDVNRKDIYWLLAEAYASARDIDHAIQYYRLITRDFVDSDVAPDAFYRLAYHLQQGKKLKEAARYYQQLADKHPKSRHAPQALYAAGYCHAQSDADAEAIRAWARLADDYGKHTLVPEALYRKALAEIRVERADDARATLTKLLKGAPESDYRADAHYWLGMLFREAGNLQDAERELRRALESEPRHELERDASFYLAAVLYRQEKFAEAAQRFQPLLDTSLADRFTSDLLEWLAAYHAEAGRHEDAQFAAQTLVEGAESDIWRQIGWCLIGRACVAQGKQAEATKAFSSALEQDANTDLVGEAALMLGGLRYDANAFDEAFALYKRAAAAAGGSEALGIRARAYFGMGRSARALEKREDAARYFMSVAILYDDDVIVPESLHQAATIFGELGQEEKQSKTMDELIARFPDSQWAQQESQARANVPEEIQP